MLGRLHQSKLPIQVWYLDRNGDERGHATFALRGERRGRRCGSGHAPRSLLRMPRTDRRRSIWSILWRRKRRSRLAETAAHRRGLDGTLAPYHKTVKVALVHLDATDQCERVFDAIRATADPEEDIADIVAGGGDDGRALVKPALDPRAGVWRVLRFGQTGASRPPRSVSRTDACYAAALE